MFGGKLIRVNEAVISRLRASAQFPYYRKRSSFQINLYFHLHCCVKLKDVENRKNEQQSIYASQVTEVSKS